MLCVLGRISHQGDSYEYTLYTFFQYKKKEITLNYPKFAAIFSKELKNGFETAVVNEPSVFESLNVYCRLIWKQQRSR